jgi:hypothetical protein
MCDTAGVYTLSAQPGTIVSENSIHSITMSPYVDWPDHWFYLYTDEGSSFIAVRDKRCEADKFLKNANGPLERLGKQWPAPFRSAGLGSQAGGRLFAFFAAKLPLIRVRSPN